MSYVSTRSRLGRSRHATSTLRVPGTDVALALGLNVLIALGAEDADYIPTHTHSDGMVSVRQLERLFVSHTGTAIGEHYMALRLTRAGHYCGKPAYCSCK
jgi:anaerobic selenocysteine-containing dehydrogenase